jgi:hypothetical protein
VGVFHLEHGVPPQRQRLPLVRIGQHVQVVADEVNQGGTIASGEGRFDGGPQLLVKAIAIEQEGLMLPDGQIVTRKMYSSTVGCDDGDPAARAVA